MKRIFLIYILLFIATLSNNCYPRMINIKEHFITHSIISESTIDSKYLSFKVSEDSDYIFYNRPRGFSGSAIKYKVNLKNIQEIAAYHILNNLNIKHPFSNNIEITSSISNFQFRFDQFGKILYTSLSFDLTIQTLKDGKIILTKTYPIKNYKGTGQTFHYSDYFSYPDILALSLLLIDPYYIVVELFLQLDDVRQAINSDSILLSVTTLDAVIKTYSKEIPIILLNL